jgi:hypothetical protein
MTLFEASNEVLKRWLGYATTTPMSEVKLGTENCAFCELFYEDYFCKGCPVYEKTKVGSCEKTPYDQVLNTFYLYRTDQTREVEKGFREAAMKEFKFLAKVIARHYKKELFREQT